MPPFCLLSRLPRLLGLLAVSWLPGLAAGAQASSGDPAPAPIVRVRPRPANAAPAQKDAPPEAAPLITRPPRPRPVNPDALDGAGSTSAQSPAPRRTPRPAADAQATNPAPTPAGTNSSVPHTPRQASTGAAPAASAPSHPGNAALNRNVVVVDAGHGGTDSGSRIGDNLLEKDITLSLALRLRSLLTARGFEVVLTRDSDAAVTPTSPGAPLTLDDRAGIANHARAAACLLLHATGRGNGVHLYTSELEPVASEPSPAPWLTAQAAWVPASQQMEHSISAALGRSHIALVSSSASVRPVDSLSCPALVVELAPENGDAHTITDAGYQDRVAAAIAGALVFWQGQVQAPPRSGAPASSATRTHHTAATPHKAETEAAQP